MVQDNFLSFAVTVSVECTQIYKFQSEQHDFLKLVHDVIIQQLTFSLRLNTQHAALDSISRLTGRNHFPSEQEYDGISKRKSSKAKKCPVCMVRGRGCSTSISIKFDDLETG